MPAPSADPASPALRWGLAALVLALTLACYGPALRGELLWDDAAHVTPPELQPGSGLRLIWAQPGATQQYYPVLYSAFWAEHRLWGDSVLGYHLANVAEFAAAALLLAALLGRLGVPGAGLAAVLFAVHPVCVESVAWISEQKNTLSLVFYLLAALAYLRFDRQRPARGASRWYALAAALFVLALLTKSVTATLPAALLVVFWWRRGRLSPRRDILPLVPWFAAAAAMGLFTAWVERTHVGARGAAFDLGLGERCVLAARVVWFYLGKLCWPAHLVFIYPHWDVKAAALGWTGYLLAALGLTAVLWAIRGRSRGPLAAWLLFVGSLFPALGFFDVFPFLFSYVADHFQFLASLAPVAAFAAGTTWLLARVPVPARRAGWGLVGAIVAALALLSRSYSRTYTDPVTLYTMTIARNPGCWMAHNNLGLWYEDHGDTDRAIGEYDEAIRRETAFPPLQNNLGGILRRVPARRQEAFAHLSEAIRLQPNYPEAHTNLGVWYEDGNDLADAVAEFEEAVRERPGYAEAHEDLGSALAPMPGRLDDAVAQFQAAVRLQPGLAEAHNNLGSAWVNEGRLDDALAEYREAIRLKPDLAILHYNLANALQRKPEDALQAAGEFETAIRLRPDYGEAHASLGLLLAARGRFPDALAHDREALRLLPGFAGIHYNIAMVLIRIPGREEEAATELEAFLRAVPGNESARRVLEAIRSRPR